MKFRGAFNLGNAVKASEQGVARGLAIGGEIVLGDSNAQVPHEEGDLMRTGAVSVDPATRRGAVSYRDVAYRGQAVDQHENMQLKHDSGRNAKFLERALVKNRDAVREAIAAQLRKGFGG